MARETARTTGRSEVPRLRIGTLSSEVRVGERRLACRRWVRGRGCSRTYPVHEGSHRATGRAGIPAGLVRSGVVQ